MKIKHKTCARFKYVSKEGGCVQCLNSLAMNLKKREKLMFSSTKHKTDTLLLKKNIFLANTSKEQFSQSKNNILKWN